MTGRGRPLMGSVVVHQLQKRGQRIAGRSKRATYRVAWFRGVVRAGRLVARQWSPQAATTSLDRRAAWWMGWKTAQRDHETFCVSCHTALPYALVRLKLRGGPTEAPPETIERRLVDNV